jgi:hypothetical protein
MKKIIFVFAILFALAHENVKCEFIGFLTYEYSFETGADKNVHNHSVGYDLLITIPSLEDKLSPILMYSDFGLFAKGINNNFAFNLQYIFNFSFIGTGISFSYNVEEKIYGIGPVLYFTWVVGFIKPNLFYRYNFYFGKSGTHEIGISMGFLNLFDILFFGLFEKQE